VHQLNHLAGPAAFATQHPGCHPSWDASHNGGQPPRARRIGLVHPGFGSDGVAGQRCVKHLPHQRANVMLEKRFCCGMFYREAQARQDLVAALQCCIVDMPYRKLP